MVYFHGGGFVLGDLDTHGAPCRLLCRHSGTHVLSVDYRLAPEHPLPAAVEDGRAALHRATSHAAELGADPYRVTVAGDSAGGNIAAVAAWEASRDGGPAPVLQVLLYPATDMIERSRSHELFGCGFLLTPELMDWFAAQYVADADPADPRLSVLRAEDLGGAPPAYVATAGFDPLRDEGEAYAKALRGRRRPRSPPTLPRPRTRLLQRHRPRQCLPRGPHRGGRCHACAHSDGFPTGHLPRALNRRCPRARVKRRCARPQVRSLGSS